MLYCDFCGKSQKDVKKIISGGNGAAICNDCVLVCVEALIDTHNNENPNPNINIKHQAISNEEVPIHYCIKCDRRMDITNVSTERRKDGDTIVDYKCRQCGIEDRKTYNFNL